MERTEVGGFDADFLRDLTVEEAFPVKRLARISGMSIDTIYAYRDGRIRIPVAFWRAVFRATRDIRIAMLILGDTNCEILFPDNVPDIASDVKLFAQAIEAIGKFHAEQKYFAEIASDGRINETDLAAITEYRKHFFAFRIQHLAIFRAVNKVFERATAAAT